MVAALPPQKEGYGVMLSNDQIETWRDEGAVVMQLPADIYEPALEWLNDNCTLDHCDDSEFAFDTPDRKFEFPTFVDELDDFILHEQFIAAVGQLLGTFDIRLALAHFWPKIGAAAGTQAQDSSDQRMHMDYGNNTILHPDWHQPDAVTAIVYFDDSDEVAGGTGFVTRTGESDPVYQPPFVHMPGQAGKPFINDRASAEQWFKENDPDAYKLRQQLNEREAVVAFKPGTVLFYRHDLWHRGTPVVPGKLRRVQSLVWIRADARGCSTWNEGWARQCYLGKVEAIIGRAKPLQRSLLDFPLPEDDYWTAARLDNVEARFAPFGFDATPYREKLP